MDNTTKKLLKSIIPGTGLMLAVLGFVGVFRIGFGYVLGMSIPFAIPLAFTVLVVGAIIAFVIARMSYISLSKTWSIEGEDQ